MSQSPTAEGTQLCETCAGSGWRMVAGEPCSQAGFCRECEGAGVIEGGPTGLRCRATNSGLPDYLLCGRELYRYTTRMGQIDQCAGGHFSDVPEGEGQPNE